MVGRPSFAGGVPTTTDLELIQKGERGCMFKAKAKANDGDGGKAQTEARLVYSMEPNWAETLISPFYARHSMDRQHGRPKEASDVEFHDRDLRVSYWPGRSGWNSGTRVSSGTIQLHEPCVGSFGCLGSWRCLGRSRSLGAKELGALAQPMCKCANVQNGGWTRFRRSCPCFSMDWIRPRHSLVQKARFANRE